MSVGASRKAILGAMGANAGIAVAKFVAYLVTGSASMLAESIHSVADTSNQGLLLVGGRKAAKIANDRHQFGFGRERYFWSFIVAMVLFALGGLFSIYEGIEKIRHPHQVESVVWAIGVLVFALVAEALSFRTAVQAATEAKGSKSWWGYIRSSRTPELPVVLLEDAGALIGMLLALLGVGLTAITGDALWDGMGTLSIGVLLVAISVVLSVEMKSLLIGEAATEAHVAAMVSAVSGVATVSRVIDLKTQHLGPDDLLVAAKIEFDGSLTNPQVSRAINDAENALRRSVPLTLQIYLEPDLYDEDHVDTK